MSFLQLKVVVWKNFLIRKRHWLLTIIESILPILLFLLIAYGRSKITGLNKTEITEVTYNEPQVVFYTDLDVSETRLFYAPNTEFFQDLMKRVQVKFQMYNNNIKGFSSSDSLLEYYESYPNNTVVAIIFNGDHKYLDYVIRVHDEYYPGNTNTAELYINANLFQPGIGTLYHNKGYLSIQKAIDVSFIEKVSGKDFDDNLTLLVQEFPYPPYKQDSALTTLFMLYLPVITLFSFIFICPAVLKRVVEEKYSGTKELMKMVGMKSWMLWLGWFIYGMLPMLLSVFCIVLLMKVPFFGTEYPPIEHTDGSILFFFLVLYCMAATTFCFALGSVFHKPTIAMVAGILIWILTYFVPKYGLGLEETGTNLTWFLSMLLNIFPNMALHYGYLAISLYEQRGLGVQWSNFYKSSSGGQDDVTMLNVFVMLLVDMVVFMCFTMYMENVNPGKYGVRRRFLFPIYDLIKLLRFQTAVEHQHGTEPLSIDHIEEGVGLKKGIETVDLTKRYGHKLAVDKLTLNVYQNQITVLLGHNGAGKSTTMSMITGMVESTSGSIKMNGLNIKNNMDKIRKTLGLCPQHNLLFTDLTVGEHLIFFAKLKGKTSKEAETEMRQLLEMLNLLEKENSMVDTLSGGMKRKLCLGMAIIGGSKILILDEPTSGMDPESRREVWDLLLKWRGEKTILITTHFMEEADALGDWIAIMANGTLQCHGTPMYLKKVYETGYHLSLMVKNNATPEDHEIINYNIQKYVNSAELKECHGNNLVFMLLFEDKSKIAKLLTFLEKEKDELKIENISLTNTTLEDVFLKVKMSTNKNADKVFELDGKDKTSNTSNQNLFVIRNRALVIKKIQFYRKKCLTYITSAIIGLIFVFLAVYLSGNSNGRYGDNGPEIKLQLSTYKRTSAFYNGTGINVDRIKEAYKSLVEVNHGVASDVKDVQQEIINTGLENIIYYKEHVIVSAEFLIAKDYQLTALYNPIAIHSAPISVNLITSALAKTLLGDDYSITTSNWPLKTVNRITTQEYSETKVTLLWFILMPIGFLMMVASFLVFPNMEMSTNFMQLQFMCGVKPYLYWMINILVDWALYMLISMIFGVVAVLGAPYVGGKEYGVLVVIFAVYGLANIAFVCLFSRKKSISAGFALFVITGIFFGIIASIIIELLRQSQDDYYMELGHIWKIIFILVFPQVGLSHVLMIFCEKAVKNYNLDVMPRMKLIGMCMMEPNPCCNGKGSECLQYQSYFPLLEEDLLLMFLSFIIYLIINILIDTYFVKKCWARIRYFLSMIWYKHIRGQKDCYDTYTENLIMDGESNSLNAKQLHKTYSGKSIVRNINFTLKQKQCLGILGVNGAGKTTTFRMLTREEVVDKGYVAITDDKDNHMPVDHDEYLNNLGYCPQTDALNYVLTGRQILTLIANLRGVGDRVYVDKFLKLFELDQYADIPCGHYSGGNKRKLSLAIALIGYPKFVLLDEPTNGVDPSSRRKFWSLIKHFKEKKNLSFILTSHSMVECEALCNDLKIMKDGEIKKEGKISELKKDHGGFNIKLKLKNKNESAEESSGDEGYDETDSAAKNLMTSTAVNSEGYYESVPLKITKLANVGELKEFFEKSCGGEVKDEHSGLIHIYIDDKEMSWSTIFNMAEELKRKNPHLIEDYAISEASLEDIFLTVAKSNDNTDSNSDARKAKTLKLEKKKNKARKEIGRQTV